MATALPRGKYVMYYDGSCPLCAKEVRHYINLNDKHDNKIHFRDISKHGVGDVLERKGVSLPDAMYKLHVSDPHGETYVGVPAFKKIWQHLPYYHILDNLTSIPPIPYILNRVYDVWVNNRQRRASKEMLKAACNKCGTSE
eukprot:Clim_evm15s218 gene=Clim_evmTU15s218